MSLDLREYSRPFSSVNCFLDLLSRPNNTDGHLYLQGLKEAFSCFISILQLLRRTTDVARDLWYVQPVRIAHVLLGDTRHLLRRNGFVFLVARRSSHFIQSIRLWQFPPSNLYRTRKSHRL